MIKIIQLGMPSTASHLIDMHYVRTKIFKERMGWDINIDELGMEVDEYDLRETIYILSLDSDERVVGTWRILPASKPSMIRDLWPQYLPSLPIPIRDDICEASRFGVFRKTPSELNRRHFISQAAAEMIVALIDICIKCNFTEMYTFYNKSVKRLMDQIDFSPVATSKIIEFEGRAALTTRFSMTPELLEKVRKKTGVAYQIKIEDLPPFLQERFLLNSS